MDSLIIACTPAHRCDPSIAIAAARAGHVGLVDVGGAAVPVGRIREVVDRVARHAAGARWGVRWRAGAGIDLETLRVRSGRLPWLLVAAHGTSAGDRAALVEQARAIADGVLLEATGIEEALASPATGCDGVVVRANETGGPVGRRSSFLLLQMLAGRLDVPWWVRGAWGRDAAAAAAVAGANGVVLSEELWLARESPLSRAERRRLGDLDGTTTVCREVEGVPTRVLETGASEPIPLGHGIAFARGLAARYETVAGILQAFVDARRRHLEDALAQDALAADAPLARRLSTRYPIVQGPMTRVSDGADFALAVAENGALPFVALALLRGDKVRTLLEEVRDALGERSWGVGLLGFVPPELRHEQLEVVREVRPGFALVAGGRPAQVRELEDQGIATFLHAPSPGLLEGFLDGGVRRFVLEGRECGGHVGPRSSLVLWQQALDVLARRPDSEVREVEVLFAGGVHDARSAAMVRALAAPLAARGASIGVLMGTAYLFTEEAVATGAIGETYQREALMCADTALLESGVGHATRCARTPFVGEFERRRTELLAAGRDPDEIRVALEMMNVGRLRLASKGLVRRASPAPVAASDAAATFRAALEDTALEAVDEQRQRRDGMFMIGDLASLRDEVVTMEDLHDDVASGGTAVLRAAVGAQAEVRDDDTTKRTGEPVAIVGMDCVFPGAPDLRTYWENILRGVDAITEVPPERWAVDRFYDEDRTAPNRVYARHGGFLPEVRFDPLRYRMPPATLRQVEPVQLLSLEVARRALEDAGYARRPLPRSRTSVVFGSSGIHDLGIAHAFQTMLPHYLAAVPGLASDEQERIVAAAREQLPRWTEDSFPGMLPSVIAGRVANRLDLGGANFTVDAACSSSLAALQAGVDQLRAGTCDVLLVGGADASSNLFTFTGFARTHALTPSERGRPFDRRADGIVLGEGVGAVVLKRLADAERDGDRIYAVLRGVGFSSDGRNKSLTAPFPEAQVTALRRAYEDAGVEPSTVELIEAHATGTAVGDAAEVGALQEVFGGASEARSCAVGSVKSMIGHAKAAAGIAGLIKTALAVHQGALPPTLHVDEPNPRLEDDDSPFYVSARSRPWVARAGRGVRRAGVSAFGFGGTNFHLVVEAYRGEYLESRATDLAPRAVELFAWRRPSREALRADLEALRAALEGAGVTRLDELAHAVFLDEEARRRSPEAPGVRLAIVSATVEELVAKLEAAVDVLGGSEDRLDRMGLYLSDAPAADPSEVAFLFPGQGAQRPDMLGDLVAAPTFGPSSFERADALLEGLLPARLSTCIFPPPAFTKAEAARQRDRLNDTRIAQPAIGVVELFAVDVLRRFGIRPARAAGHSYGEYTALTAGGASSPEDQLRLSALRGRAVHETGRAGLGGMAAVAAGADETHRALETAGIDAHVANYNAPRQTIIGGSDEAIEAVLTRLPDLGFAVRRVAVTAPFHTPALKATSRGLGALLEDIDLAPPRIPVYSNVTAAPYPDDVASMRDILAEHLAHPVRFVEQVRAMHADGARIFLEVGPGRILTGLVRRILEGEPHTAIALDQTGESSWRPLAHLLSHLHALGLPLSLGAWFDSRGLASEGVEAHLARRRRRAEGRPTDWWISPEGARPVQEAPPIPEAEDVPMRDERGASPPTSRPDADLVARVQDMTAQWVQLQREQARLTERFLALQERLVSGHLGNGNGHAPSAPPSPAAAPRPVGAAGVAPAPVLPPLEATSTPPVREEEAAPARPPAPAPAETGAPPTEVFRADLLAEVSRRTGYPEDMLDPELPLEAGLGIDSIKVMEIFSALKRYHAVLSDPDGNEEDLLARFASLKTLGAILAYYDERRSGAPAEGETLRPFEPGGSDARVERRVTRAVRIPTPEVPSLDGDPLPVSKSLPLLLLGEVEDLGALLRTGLEQAGYRVRHVVPGRALRRLDARRWEANFEDPEAVRALAAGLSEADASPVGALLNLLPLDPACAAPGAEALDEAVALSRRHLHVAQAFGDDLRRAAVRGGGLVVNVTALDGRFGLAGRGPLPVAQAASVGFWKSVAREWPDVTVRQVDLDPRADPQLLLGGLGAHLAAGTAEAEIGFDAEGAWRVEEAAEDGDAGPLDLDETSVVLVTGGAYGITAGILEHLARATRARLVLTGRSPRPSADDEPPELRAAPDDAALRQVLLQRDRARGERRTPAEVEHEVRAVLTRRRIRESLVALESAGSAVEYHTLDVTDEAAFEAFVGEVYGRLGRIDGVLHAAGVIEDRRVGEKTAASLERVMRTKLVPARVLARALRPEGLRFLAFFSSVSARWGNAGQSDYAAANECLNKLADHLDRDWPARVVSVGWGPWASGMVTEAHAALYARRGVRTIPPDDGARAFLAELSRADGASEVILACTPDAIARGGRP